jgi:hypothetical protein
MNRLTNPSREPEYIDLGSMEKAPRMCASDIALLFISGMGAGFLIALLTLGEVVVK